MEKKVEEEIKKALDSVIHAAAPKDEDSIGPYLGTMRQISRSAALAPWPILRSWFHERVTLWSQLTTKPHRLAGEKAAKHLEQAAQHANEPEDTEAVEALRAELKEWGHV